MLDAAQPYLLAEAAPPPVPAAGITPRPYQERGVEAIRARLRAGVRRVLAQLPTGGGKTTVAAMIALGAIGKGKRVLFVAHRSEIVAQAYWRLVESGVPETDCGVVMADGKIPHPKTGALVSGVRRGAPVQVGSVQTLARRRPLPPADVVFIDEAHHAAADTWATLVAHYEAAGATVVGLTATPERADGLGLRKLFDALVPIATMSELVTAGYLVAPQVFTTPHRPDLSDVKVTRGDYDVAELSRAMRTATLVGDLVDHWKRLAGGRSTVVFAVDTAHSREIVQAFCDAGVTAEHLDGATPKADRAAILARLASGETTVVSNCAVLTEGFDCPRVKCVALARPTKSLSLYLQMVGRGLRPWQDVSAIILDHAGSALEHGLPQEDREWSLDGRATPRTRRCAGCKAPLSKRAKQCPACGLACADITEAEAVVRLCPAEGCDAVLPRGSRECAVCGAVLPGTEVEVADGELVEIDMEARRRELAERESARKAVATEVGRLTRELGCDFADINRAIYKRFRRRRIDQSASELDHVLQWLRGAGRATLAALKPPASPAAADDASLLPTADASPTPVPVAPAPQARRIDLAGLVAALPPPRPALAVGAEEVEEWSL